MLFLSKPLGRQREHTMQRIRLTSVPAAVLAIAVAFASPVFAQAHQKTVGDLTLRASTVSADSLPLGALQRHEIARGAGKALLNVTVMRSSGGVRRHIPARVEVEARNAGGLATNVEVREVVENGRVTYPGVYDFLPREVIDFRISAQPLDSERIVRLKFRHRLGRRQ